MTAAGTLNRRIRFRRATTADDGYAQAEAWADHGAPIWAGRRDVSDGEKAAAGAIYAELAARFVVRSSAFTRGVTPKDRILHEGRDWAILGIKEIEGGRALEITATVRTDVTG